MAYMQARTCDRNGCGGAIVCAVFTSDGQPVGSFCAAHGREALGYREGIEEDMLRVQEQANRRKR